MINSWLDILYFLNIAIIVLWIIIEEIIVGTQQRKKNAKTKNMDRGSSVLMYILAGPGFFFGIFAAFTMHGYINILFPYISIIGFDFIVFGIIVRHMAIKTLNNQFTFTVEIFDDHKLITTGMYKYVRHPSYLGQLLMALGMGMAFSNWISILFIFGTYSLAVIYRISVEEKALTFKFGDQYLEYKKRTKFLLPGML